MSNTTKTSAGRWKKVWDVPSHTKSAAQRHLAILALGSMQALRHKRITVRQAWDNGLNFKTYLDLKNLNADRRLLEMWEWAMELPQVAKLGQAALAESIDAIEARAAALLAGRKTIRMSSRLKKA